MFYELAQALDFPGILNLIRYLSFRAGAAALTALVIGLLIGPKFIGWLRLKQGKGQPIREDGPASHLITKKGTPTMGGLMILAAMTLSTLLWMDFSNRYTWACLFVTLGFGLIGFLDDYDKVTKRSHKGVSGKVRLLLEFAIAMMAVFAISQMSGTMLYLPFLKDAGLELGLFYILFAATVIVGSGNAVNLTDGLDGLATMPVIIAALTFAVIAYLVGNALFADYLGVHHVLGAGDLAVFCAAIIGAGLAFLWYNAPPAAVRSEEHTSELQSLMRISYAVFCLKKKKIMNQQNLTFAIATHKNTILNRENYTDTLDSINIVSNRIIYLISIPTSRLYI